MNPQEFITKWKKAELSERSACQQHFCDLCELLGQSKPAQADPAGTWYTFERGVRKTTGGHGWADVWMRGHFGWEYKGKHKNLAEAYQQLLLYREDLENPPLLIVCDLECFEIHTNFTGTVKRVYAFDLDGLTDPQNLEVLRKVFTDPHALRPDQTAVGITEAAAGQFGQLADSLRQRGVPAPQAAHFLMKLMFCFFAEDVGLLPRDILTNLLHKCKEDPQRLSRLLAQLFQAMMTGGDFGAESIRHFNGGLFNDADVIALRTMEIEKLVVVGRFDWSSIEPSVFGTLFERTLDPGKRAQVGAQYTGKEDILTLVEPVLMRPLRREWAAVRAKCDKLWEQIQAESRRNARRRGARAESPKRRKHDRLLQDFVERLAHVQILDPACGSGNFLYVAIQSLLDLEKQVITFAADRGLPLFPQVRPTQLHGIEILPYAHELAQVVIWIGYLQWMRLNGFKVPGDPILEPIETIHRRDAILDLSDPPNPREPQWPAADVIIGNPPFLGGKLLRRQLSDEYIDALFKLWNGRVPREADLCCYWFEKARAMVENVAQPPPAGKDEIVAQPPSAGKDEIVARPPSAGGSHAHPGAGVVQDRDAARPPSAGSSDAQRRPDVPQLQSKRAREQYRRNLPHIQPPEGRAVFVTFSTYKRWTLPESVRDQVLKHCLHDHGTKLWMHAAVVMPDHVHMIFTPGVDSSGNPFGLAEIMNGIKGASAHTVNKALRRRGHVWQDESFDHILRKAESLRAKCECICANPVRKGLVKDENAYPWLWREWVEGVAQPPSAGKDEIVAQPPSAGGSHAHPGAGVVQDQDVAPPPSAGSSDAQRRAAVPHTQPTSIRAGLLATQGIRGGANREVLKRIKETGDIFFAVSDRDWILEGANVHVSMIGFDDGSESERMLDGELVVNITPNLTRSFDASQARKIPDNIGIYVRSPEKGAKFEIPEELALQMLKQPNPNGRSNTEVLHRWANAKDIANGRYWQWIIDFHDIETEAEAAQFEAPFEHIRKTVYPFRQKNRYQELRKYWWRFRRSGDGVRNAVKVLPRLLCTPMTAKHRLFVWLDPSIQPDKGVPVFARDDNYFFGVLHSAVHERWSRRMGTQLREAESGCRYTPTTCFETFPFPPLAGGIAQDAHPRAGVPQNVAQPPPAGIDQTVVQPPSAGSSDAQRRAAVPQAVAQPPSAGMARSHPGAGVLRQRIADAAAKLNELRENWLNPVFPSGGPMLTEQQLRRRTLTNLYNDRPTWLELAHLELDRAVLAAYGMPEEWAEKLQPNRDPRGKVNPILGVSDPAVEEQLLARLLELNLAGSVDPSTG